MSTDRDLYDYMQALFSSVLIVHGQMVVMIKVITTERTFMTTIQMILRLIFIV